MEFLGKRSARLGELQYPADQVRINVAPLPTVSDPKFMGVQFLQSYDMRVEAREGERLIRQLRFWTITFILSLILALLTSVRTPMSRATVSYETFLVFDLGNWLSLLFLLGAAFSMGSLYLRVVSYGWLPWLRLFWLRSTRNRVTRAWWDGRVSRSAKRTGMWEQQS
jgi:hypothetical protein